MVTLTIDGIQIQAPEGTLIVDAARNIGINIPVFCYHPKMEPVGMCRMCLVEVGRPVIDRATGQPVLESNGAPKIQFNPKLETACTTPISEGMVVLASSQKCKAARKEVVEFILTSHPLDCPVCDKGGECPLQNLTMAYGPGQSRFLYSEKMHLEKHVPLGELIYLDRERCIQCGRCVRFQSDIAGDAVIGFYHRGRALEITTISEPGFASYFSGNTTDICPVGALTTADFRFGARPWELGATASICSQCPVGCNLTFNVRREAKSGGQVVIKRAMPRQNETVNEIWICDKGRFAYHFNESKERLSQPLVRRNGELVPASWEETLNLVAQKLSTDSALLGIASGRLSNEDLFNFNQLISGLGGRAALSTSMAGGDLTAQVGVGKGTNFNSMGKGTAILVVASDLEEEAPIWRLRIRQAVQRGATLIVANPRPTKLEREAAHILRYPYGSEVAVVQEMINALSAREAQPSNKNPLSTAVEVFANAENAVILFGSEGLGLKGSSALAQACANLLIVTNHYARPDNGLIGVWQRANDQGAWDMGLRPVDDLAAAIQSAKALYIAAADPVGDDLVAAAALRQAVQSGAFIVVQELFLTETARMADVVLPVLAYTEREGTFTSGERRVQRFYPAVPERKECRADFAIFAAIGKRLKLDIEGSSSERVMRRIANQAPAYAGLGDSPYRKLAETEEQYPLVGRKVMYYGGTTYENKQGLGVQLSTSAERGEAISPAFSPITDAPPLTSAGDFLAVPVTKLYDRGQTLIPSSLLHQRLLEPCVFIHPDEARRLGLQEGDVIQISVAGAEKTARLQLDEAIPAASPHAPAVLLAPRSVGLSLHEPTRVHIQALAGAPGRS